MVLKKVLAALALIAMIVVGLPARAQFQPGPVIGPSTATFNGLSQSHIWTCTGGLSTFALTVPTGMTGVLTVTTAQSLNGTYGNPPIAFVPSGTSYANTITNSGKLTVVLGSDQYVTVTTTAYTSGSTTVSGTCSTAVAALPAATPAGGVYPISGAPTPIPTPPGGVYPVSGVPTPVPTPTGGIYPVSGVPTPIPTPTGGIYPISGAPTPIPTPTGGIYPISGAPTPIPTPAGGTYPISGAPTPIPTPAGGVYPISGAPTPIPWASNSPEPVLVINAAIPLIPPTTPAPVAAPTTAPVTSFNLGLSSAGYAPFLLCDNTAAIAINGTGAVGVIPATAGKRIMICGLHFRNSGTAPVGVNLQQGTKTTTDCDTSLTNLTGSNSVQESILVGTDYTLPNAITPYYILPAGFEFCIKPNATAVLGGSVSYALF